MQSEHAKTPPPSFHFLCYPPSGPSRGFLLLMHAFGECAQGRRRRRKKAKAHMYTTVNKMLYHLYALYRRRCKKYRPVRHHGVLVGTVP